jgi:uncharacterized damage-inducible protein DinB
VPAGRKTKPIALDKALVEAFAVNERMNQFLLENLDEEAWRAEPPGGKGRTIAAIVAHIHNVRHMWLSVSAKGSEIPRKLDRWTVSRAQARLALAKSGEAMRRLLEASLSSGGRVKDFPPGIVAFFAYAISHDAHHRGQICQLARQAGFPLSNEATHGMWDWTKRRKEI